MTNSGWGFISTPTVSLDGLPAVSVTVDSPSQIVAVSPWPHEVGAVTVTVSAAGGSVTAAANPGAVFN